MAHLDIVSDHDRYAAKHDGLLHPHSKAFGRTNERKSHHLSHVKAVMHESSCMAVGSTGWQTFEIIILQDSKQALHVYTQNPHFRAFGRYMYPLPWQWAVQAGRNLIPGKKQALNVHVHVSTRKITADLRR